MAGSEQDRCSFIKKNQIVRYSCDNDTKFNISYTLEWKAKFN